MRTERQYQAGLNPSTSSRPRQARSSYAGASLLEIAFGGWLAASGSKCDAKMERFFEEKKHALLSAAWQEFAGQLPALERESEAMKEAPGMRQSKAPLNARLLRHSRQQDPSWEANECMEARGQRKRCGPMVPGNGDR